MSERATARWDLVTSTPYLAEVARLVNDRSASSDPLFAGILGSFALFAGNLGGLLLIADLVGPGSIACIQSLQDPEPNSRERQILTEGVGDGSLPTSREARLRLFRPLTRKFAVAVFILSPDALEMLANILAGRSGPVSV